MLIFSILGAAITILFIFIIIYAYVKFKNFAKAVSDKNNFWFTVFIAVGKTIDEKVEEQKKKSLPTPTDLKREAFKKRGLKTFYYLDKGQIEDLYPQISTDLELKRMETNTIKESGGAAELKAQQFAGIKANKTTKEDIKAVYENADKNLSSKYTEIENHFASYAELKFGLEDILDQNEAINEFKKACIEFTKKFMYEITEQQQQQHLNKILRMKALNHLKVLSKSTGYYAMQIEVKVIETNEEYYVLSYDHPVNQYLSEEDKKFQLNLKCSNKNFTETGKHSMTKDKLFNVTCLAKVSSWDISTSTLELSPIAIY